MYLKMLEKIVPKLRWHLAQKGEKKWWENWLKEHQNDDAWLRMVLDYFNLNENQDLADKVLVDIGSGPIGILTKLKAKEKIAVDPLPIMSLDKTIKRIKVPGEKIPLPNESVDCIFIYNVLQHVMSPQKVLEEGARILKKGGTFYLLEQLNLPTNKLHPHSLKLEMFEKWISKNNFKILKKAKEDDCYFDHPCVPSSGYSILCLILRKEA